VPGVLVAANGCWDLTVHFFKVHTWQARFCKTGPVAQRIPFIRTANRAFNRSTGGIYGCFPDDIIRDGMKPGDRWDEQCGPKLEPRQAWDAKTVAPVEFVGLDTLDVGGKKVECRHMRRTPHVKGKQSGATVRDLWFAVRDGLLVRIREKAKTSGLLTYESDYELTLSSLEPTR
jgi:hypothetical protein